MSDQVAEMSAMYLVEATDNGVPVGYKQTEAGVIPKEWEVKRISEIASVFSGGTPNRETSYYWGGDIPWVTTSLIDGAEITTAKEFITRKGVESSSAKWCKPGTILIAMYGQGKTRGKTALLNINATINQACAAIELKDSNYNKYIFHTLKSMYGRIRELSNSGGQENLSSGIIKSISIPFPSKKEQTAIANALSDVDALISELEKLIAKKQGIKTATMQQLLTGRKRLPQFALHEDGTPKGYKQSELGEIPEGWELLEVGKFAPLQRGFDLPSTIRKDGKYPVVYSNGIANTHHQFQVKGPGVVTGRSGTLGKVHFVDTDYWPHNTSLWVTNFGKADPKFVYFLFTYIGFERFASGSGVPTLNRNDAHSFKTALPSTKLEQKTIANILSDIDEEIQTLEQRLGKTRQIKQGMMQELLTGKTRLVAPAA